MFKTQACGRFRLNVCFGNVSWGLSNNVALFDLIILGVPLNLQNLFLSLVTKWQILYSDFKILQTNCVRQHAFETFHGKIVT